MKVRRLNRRTYKTFNSFDAATGYTVRYGQAKDGGWGAMPDAFMAICGARTLKQVKKIISEAIQIHLEHARENGLPIPKPEMEVAHASR
jgi:predicted RNase H-like HicB family nuclease